jgi:pimeloyl-ACP methyl ester carboxylesterase
VLRILAVLLLACVFRAGPAPAAEPPTPRVEPSAGAPLGQMLQWTSPAGQPYGYRLPRKIDRQRPPNLVFMLHGTGLQWGWAFWNYPIAAGGFRGNDIIVAPEGMTPGQGGTFNFIQGKADGDQIAGLIAVFKRAFPIARVYIYGHSQGAFFAYWFAGDRPELVDGIVAHAGNVLDVKHSKLAKEKVAIGILHGKADQVVPVECAYRTEKIYKEQGYKQVKLFVVEGLTAQSGHWPLPKEAGEMFDWLDSVSQDSARGVADIALHELAKNEVDLGIVAEAAARGETLLKGYKGADRAAVSEKLKAIAGLIEAAQAAHAAAVKSPAGTPRKDKDYGPWAAHFRAADAALGRLGAWQSSVKQLRSRAQSHDKLIAAVLPRLDKAGERDVADALKAAEQAFLSSRYAQLLVTIEKSKALKPADAGTLKALLDSRRPADEEGARAAAAKTKELVAGFREAHRDWFQDAGK